MSKLKKFFSKKKEEAAFKLKMGNSLGQGHKLNASNTEASTSQRKPSYDVYQPPKRKQLSDEARAAAAAALSRIETKNSKDFNTSLAAIKARAKRELEAERKLNQGENSSANTQEISNENLACHGVYFRCPLISDSVLSKKEWKAKIKEFLYQQAENEKALTACLIIQNCNTKEKADNCVDTVSKYLENLINHPNEEKFCKIRMENRIFKEKVRHVEGAMDFLIGAGFREIELDGEQFLIWSKDNIENGQDLPSLLEALKNAEPITLELERDIKVLLPSQARNAQLPDDFYRISAEEIKREQQLRTDAFENAQVLKTKAMREREEQRTLRMFRYAIIRVKFPNGIHIQVDEVQKQFVKNIINIDFVIMTLTQGTFNVTDKLSDIFEFVQSCLHDESLDFNLVVPDIGKFNAEDMDKTIYDLRLIPTTVMLFTLSEMNASLTDVNFLKEELLLLVQSI